MYMYSRLAIFVVAILTLAVVFAVGISGAFMSSNYGPDKTPRPSLTAKEKLEAFEAAKHYEIRPPEDPNGIGKYFMGRQIAHVMGHQGADWLERPTREAEEHTEEMINLLGLKPGDRVADIGAGTGYITWRMAKRVAPSGRVYAVEIQQEMLNLLQRNMRTRDVTNVVGVLGSVTDPGLGSTNIDLIIMVDVYHEFDHPWEMTTAMVRALKPGGRLVFVEFKKEDPNVPIKEVHKMSEAQVKKEMSIHPLEHSQTLTNLPWQHVIIFKKTAPKPRAGVDLHSAPKVQSLSQRPAKISIENTTANRIVAK